MRRIITQRRLREYARAYPQAKASLTTWQMRVMEARWATPADVRQTFNDADPVTVGSGNTVYVFNIQRNEHRLIAAIHFNTGMVYVLRIMTHKEYDRGRWKDEL